MSKPKLFINVWLKLVFEAEGVVVICTLSSSIRVVKERVVVILVTLHAAIRCSLSLWIPRDIILSI